MPKNERTYADDLPYWKTSRSHPDTWLEKAGREIERAGGEVTLQLAVQNTARGEAAFMIGFILDGDDFRIEWPVLTPKRPADLRWARVQTATMVYHDVKARCVSARVHGARRAFCAYLILPDSDQTVGRAVSVSDLAGLPPQLTAMGRLLPAGEGS